MSLPKVSVVVPVFNAAHCLPRLMESLYAQEYPRDRMEVILVDNKSTDNSVEVIRQYSDVVALSQTQWQTPGATRNAGIERASGEVLAFIDADCWAQPNWLRTRVTALVEEKLDRVAGRVEFVLSSHPNIYEIYDSAINFGQPDFVTRGWSGTGNLFARRGLFEEAGLFDPVLRSAEDCEFGLRATGAGKSLGYAPDAVIYHHARTSLMSLVKKWIRTEYGAAQVFRRHGADILAGKPIEFIQGKTGAGLVHTGKREALHQLLARQDLGLVVEGPAHQCQPVDDCGSRIATLLIELERGLRMLPLGELPATCRRKDQWQVSELWAVPTQRIVNQKLLECVGEVVFTPYHISDLHEVIINNHSEVVDGYAVGTDENDVLDLAVINAHLTSNEILNNRTPCLRNLESPGVFPASLDTTSRLALVQTAARSVVAIVDLARLLIGTNLGETLFATKAGVDCAR